MGDFVEAKLWGEQRLELLRRFLPYERGVPSHDTLNDVMNGIDADLFGTCSSEWAEALRDGQPDSIAGDGKTSRRCHARDKGREPLHRVSAWASRRRLVLGQEATDVTSNEITAISLLLERLDLTGALVTIDVVSTQTGIADTILRRGCDDLLSLEADRPTTRDDVARSFDDPEPGTVEPVHETLDASHGRLEQRKHAVCRAAPWTWSDRRYAGEPRFPHLAMVGLVETRVERGGKIEREKRCHRCSAKLDAKTFANAVRTHRHIENRSHWTLDVVFHDDLVRLRTGDGPQNMAVVRHFAMNALRVQHDKHGLRSRRKLASLNLDDFEKVVLARSPLTRSGSPG